MFRIDKDGYIRIEQHALRSLQFVHLVSGSDEDAPPPGHWVRVGAGATGHTEWVTITIPAVSIGWEWAVDDAGRDPIPQRVGHPYGNVMIVDEQGQDVGAERSAHLLDDLADRLAWQAEIMAIIGCGHA